eukprot:5805497-Amphidinium_carterae.1
MLPPHTLPHALHFTISIVPALSSFKHIWLTMPLDNSGPLHHSVLPISLDSKPEPPWRAYESEFVG